MCEGRDVNDVVKQMEENDKRGNDRGPISKVGGRSIIKKRSNSFCKGFCNQRSK